MRDQVRWIQAFSALPAWDGPDAWDGAAAEAGRAAPVTRETTSAAVRKAASSSAQRVRDLARGTAGGMIASAQAGLDHPPRPLPTHGVSFGLAVGRREVDG
jgi:hypothetical protein